MERAAVALMSIMLAGCCWLAKRNCFPACPPAAPTQVVTIEKVCELPPTLRLPAIVRTEAGCPADRICYTVGEAAKIWERDAQLVEWVQTARDRCSPKPKSGSTSHPILP